MAERKFDFQSLTAKSFQEGKLVGLFPELYELTKVTENSAWHDHQTVFAHVVAVLEQLEELLKFETLTALQKANLEKYLAETIGGAKRRELLVVATMLHDNAKIDTLIRQADGTAVCPGHALIGAARVKQFAGRLNLETQAEDHVERIVRYHGLVSEILDLIIANGNKEGYLAIFEETVGDVAIELILLMLADLLGADLAKNDRKAFDTRVELLSWMLAHTHKPV